MIHSPLVIAWRTGAPRKNSGTHEHGGRTMVSASIDFSEVLFSAPPHFKLSTSPSLHGRKHQDHASFLKRLDLITTTHDIQLNLTRLIPCALSKTSTFFFIMTNLFARGMQCDVLEHPKTASRTPLALMTFLFTAT